MVGDYEIAILLSSQLPEGRAEESINRYQKVITDHAAQVLKVDRWGVRKLAYEIGKQGQADFTFIQFRGGSDAVNELDRLCKLDEGVLRHMIVRPDGGFEPEPEPEEATPAAEEAAEDDGTQDVGDDDEDDGDSDDESEEDGAESGEDEE